MTPLIPRRVLAAATAVAVLALAGTAWSADPLAIVKQRQDTMKGQGRDLKTIENYGKGTGDRQAAVAAATELTRTVPGLPDLFPKGTGTAEFPGKSGARPAIWTEWGKFLDADKKTAALADALLVKIKAGDQAAAVSGPRDLWDNGCQGCHKPFRKKL